MLEKPAKLSLKEEKVQYKDKELRLAILELENAVLVFFSEGSLKLGTVSVAIPREDAMTSSNLLGGKYLLSSRALAERTAAAYRKMSLASIHTQLSEAEALRIAADLLRKTTSDKS